MISFVDILMFGGLLLGNVSMFVSGFWLGSRSTIDKLRRWQIEHNLEKSGLPRWREVD